MSSYYELYLYYLQTQFSGMILALHRACLDHAKVESLYFVDTN